MSRKNFQQKLNSLPTTSGVYLHKNKSGRIIYIGKASNLKNRVRSYFSDKESYTPARAKLTTEITNFEIIETDTEIDALILEANLIKKYKPKYNVLLKDDKNYFFVGITNPSTSSRQEKNFPRIFITHQPIKLQTANHKLPTNYIGPFTDGSSLKIVLRLLRKIFPYCTCKNTHKRNCVNADIGLCLGFCCNTNLRTSQDLKLKYQTNIKNIIEILKGNKKKILKDLNKKMLIEAKKENFETANDYKKQMLALERIFKHSNVIAKKEYAENLKNNWQKISETFKKLLKIEGEISRIEAYDISNISGQHATGSMVVFENGLPDKKKYRVFKIKNQSDGSPTSIRLKPNDCAMLQEILTRRFNHQEWPLPQIILIDGGKGQLNAAEKIISNPNIRLKINILSLAKKEEILFGKNFPKGLPIKNLPQNIQNLFINLRDEAHRFAIKLHRKIRNKNLLK